MNTPMHQPTQPNTHTNETQAQARGHAFPGRQQFRGRRGSALLLVVGVLLLIFIAGIAFVSSAQSQRIAGAASARTANTDAAVEATVNYIGQVIAKDWADYATGTGSEYQDYPHPDIDPWLASTEPEDYDRLSSGQKTFLDSNTVYGSGELRTLTGAIEDIATQLNGDSDDDGDANNDWDVWRNVSRLDDLSPTPTTPLLRFIDTRYFLPLGENANDPDDIYDSPPGSVSANDDTQVLTYHPVARTLHSSAGDFDPMNDDSIEANLDTTADADGDGYIDSYWVELPISAPGGLRWAAAVRVIDETALANVNTATEIEEDYATPRDAMALGTTPADLNLKHLLARADFTQDNSNNSANWENQTPANGVLYTQESIGREYDAIDNNSPSEVLLNIGFDAAGVSQDSYAGSMTTENDSANNDQVPRAPVYASLGYYDATYDSTYSSPLALPIQWIYRDQSWWAYGRNLDNPWSQGTARTYNSPHSSTTSNITAPYTPFGTDSLLELRERSGLNNPAWSPLEYALFNEFDPTDNNAWSVLRSNRTESTGALTRRQMRMSIRHLLTTYSGSRQIRPRVTSGSYPLDVSDADHQTRSKFNLNEFRKSDYATFRQRIREVVSATDLSDAEIAALAANLMAYRIPGTWNDVPSDRGVTPATYANLNEFHFDGDNTFYYGLEAQPFFREAIALVELRDPTPGDGTSPADINELSAASRYLMVEIANPWDATTTTGYDATINLSNYELIVRVNTTEYTVPLSGTLPPGDGLVIQSHGITSNGITLQNPTTTLPVGAPSVSFESARDLSTPSGSIEDLDNRFNENDDIEFELRYVRNTANILVDRFRKNTGFSIDRSDFTYAGPPADDQQIILSKSLQRDDNTTHGTPLFVLEDDTVNDDTLENLDDSNAPPNNTWQIEENLGPANGPTLYPTITAPFQLHIGKARDSAVATDYTAPRLDSVAELGLLLTVGHTEDIATGEEFPISENLATELIANPGRYAAKLDWTEINAASNDAPDAVNLMDQFTTLEGPDNSLTTNNALNPGMAFGVININTAPQRVLEALPFVLGGNASENHPMPGSPPVAPYLADGILDYRDLPNGGTFGSSSRSWPSAGTWTGPGAATPRSEPGFSSIGELTMIRRGSNSNFAFDHLRYDTTDNTETEGDFTDDDIADDLEEELLPFQRVASLVSVRSDVFTAYVVLRGCRPNADNATIYDTVVERRFIVTYDRSNVNQPGDQPRILMFSELD